METKEKKTKVKRFCQRFQIGLRRATSYDMVKSRLAYRFYTDDQLKARERFKHTDL